MNSNQMSPAFLGFVRERLLGLTMLTWIVIACAVGVGLFLGRTMRGRDLYAAGNNPSAAIYAGIDVGRMRRTALTVAGAITSLSGYLWLSRFAVAHTDVASGFELQAIAACVIGGLLLGIIKNALPLVGISPFFQMAVSGAVITGAVINAPARQQVSRRILACSGSARASSSARSRSSWSPSSSWPP